jgi:hypothetical protein
MLQFGNVLGMRRIKHGPGKSDSGKKLSQMANIGVD